MSVVNSSGTVGHETVRTVNASYAVKRETGQRVLSFLVLLINNE